MKTLSLRLDDEIFEEVEKLTSKINKARNRYINEALKMYNEYTKKRLLKKQIEKESKSISASSLEFLREIGEAYED